jgi:hypothetical protein
MAAQVTISNLPQGLPLTGTEAVPVVQNGLTIKTTTQAIADLANSGSSVSSFNTRTGAVTLLSSDVTNALGYTPVNKAGDSITGNLTVAGEIAAAGTINGAGFYSYAVGGEGGQLSLANPTNTGTVASFDVVNATTARLFTTVNNAVLQIGQLAGTGGEISLHTNSTERMRIDASGNVGIGTSFPGAKLSVVGAGSVWTTVQNTASTADAFFQAQNTLGSGYFGISPTGQYMYTADSIPLLFSTAATERMRIDSAGNVGIGTSTPGSFGKLAVAGNLGTMAVNADGDQLSYSKNGFNYITAAGAAAVLQIQATGASGLLVFGTAGSERMRIDSTGNVGIGTSSPVAPLQVSNNLPVLVLDELDGTSTHRQTWMLRNGNEYQLQTRTSTGTFAGLDYVMPTGSSGATAHVWYTANTEKVRIDSSGNVGIGTGAPGSKLDVNGTVTATSFSGRINPRVSTTASTATLTPDISSFDQYNLTAQAAALTVAAPTGTPVDGNKIMFRFLDNGTARAITWNGTYTAIGVTLPTTTVISKMLYVGCIYNAANTRWDVIAVTQQA